MDYVPKNEIDARIDALQRAVSGLGLDGCLIMQTVDLYYFTGTVQNGVLWVPAEGAATLAVRRSLKRAQMESPLERIVPFRSYRELPGLFGWAGSPRKVGAELDVVPFAVCKRLQAALAVAELSDVSQVVRRLRAVKSAYEMKQMERAAAIHVEVYQLIPSLLKEGMTELELAIALDAEYRKRGHAGPVRVRSWNQEFSVGVISAGVSANYPTSFDGPDGMVGLTPASPQLAGTQEIRRGEPLIVDMLSCYNGYLVDMTRIFCLGDPPEEAARAHDLAVKIQEDLAAGLKPGAVPEELYLAARESASASPWADGFMGFGGNRVSFVVHGVGLELDELPVLAARFREPLLQGMVVAVEPKFFLDGVGGVGVEDTFVVEAAGPRKLTEFPPEIHVL